jgi:nitrate reductase beta subunit
MLYDAEQINQAGMAANENLVDAQLGMILDPSDPDIVLAARKNGIPDGVINAAQKSPVYRFVKKWRLALPLHPEFRTLPMLFYVPPMLPVISSQQEGGVHRLAGDFFSSIENARLPMRYMSRLFAGGNEAPVRQSYQRQLAVRIFKRAQNVGDFTSQQAEKALSEAGLTPIQAEEIYRLTTQPGYSDSFVIPPMGREVAIESAGDTHQRQKESGFGISRPPKRGA